MLVGLTKELKGSDIEFHSSRPDSRVSALQSFLEIERVAVLGDHSALSQKIKHYRNVFSHLDLNQLTQIAQDKFDSQHTIRSRFSRKKSSDNQPVFLLPTAYVNVSRTAVSYAELLPSEKFLLVTARPGGKLRSLPSNVRMISLDPYFEPIDKKELTSLTEKWNLLRQLLADSVPEFRMAEALGTFAQGLQLIHWGLAARDAWMRFFDSENIAGCLSADDVNPYTSLPLFIATHRDVPTLAVHHGALDSRMATKALSADFYLAKGDLEQDYLLNSCHMDPKKIVIGGPPHVLPEPVVSTNKPWLVFFTEPYANSGWRADSVYKELLPHLCTLADECELELVFKLHPFESVKGHKNLVREFLSRDRFAKIQWIAGPPTPQLWNNIRFGMTVESTIALECAIRQVPVFLCAWLQSAYGGYLQQYAKFGVGHILSSPNEIQDVPQLLANWKNCESAASGKIWHTMESTTLRNLLLGKHPRKTTLPA